MPVKRSGLGRGLDALLPVAGASVRQLALEQLRVSAYQPRRFINPESLAELAASIADKGVLQPLLVRPVEGGFEIVAGERRFRAAQQAGLTSVPVVVKQLSDQQTLEIAIVENLQREDLSPVEEARAFKQLLAFGLSQDGVAKAVGKSRSAVANTLRLLRLEEAALTALESGRISAGHARAILAQPNGDQAWALERILEGDLSVRQAEQLKRAPEGKASRKRTPKRHYADIEEDLMRHVGTQVKIKGEGKGRIELFFFSEDELSRLLEMLGFQR